MANHEYAYYEYSVLASAEPDPGRPVTPAADDVPASRSEGSEGSARVERVEGSEPLDSSGETMGFVLWHVTLAWQRAMRAALDPHDLTHAQFVLLTSVWWLGEHEEAPSQQRIAEHAGVDAMMAGQVLRRLAARQLINRDLDDNDARARRIVLTDTGRDLLTKARADVEATDAAFFAALGPDTPVFLRGLTLLRDD